MTAAPGRVRLAELVATISLGTDLGLGQPMEHVIRQTIIALRLADLLDLPEPERVVVYYSGLLAWVGCHTDAYEQAKWFGDDIAMKREAMFSGDGAADLARLLVRRLGSGGSVPDRVRTTVTFPVVGLRWFSSILESHWKATDLLAEQLGLGDDVRRSLVESYERWDGRGAAGLRGEQIRLASRLVYLADVVAAFERLGGADAAVRMARERAGSQFDPDLVDLLCAHCRDVLAGLDQESHWAQILDREPGLARTLGEAELDDALAAIGDFADLKSPYFIGHARTVAQLAGDAAAGLGLAPDEATRVRRAALVHDLGRLGVSNGIWDKRSPLTLAEQERIRTHPYLTERMLAFSSRLAELGAIAVLHHERLDGTGYPRGLSGGAIPVTGRILAAADRYATATEERPHRPATDPDAAATGLRDDVRRGALDADAVEAVLSAAGHRVRRRRAWPAGLTTREVEVLRLLARGLSNRDIAGRLVLSPKTVGAHVEHIYAKTGANNRATAGLFAMRHGLMSDFEPAERS
ncbi:HD domain-containing phosphohydrolase [Pseudonocardia dioxanivorans]|uniref:HD domain-containing phosphohydrolase n=1 Tax=Pseudonocardia dioxanivorans TaxID=240495 RepID=UPI000CD0C752|nr:HD domain-containing phosphohydrolase [Pseudonocardia dioxanivorans]